MRTSQETFVTGLIMGVFAGAIVAILYAPSEGPALRSVHTRRRRRAEEPMIDEQLDESFPASDPPSWTSSTSSHVS